MSIDALRASCPDEAMIPSMRRLWKEAFGDSDEALDCFFESAYSKERCRVIADGNEVLGALYIFDCECKNKKIAYIYAVATLEKVRGQGICRALMSDTHNYLKKKGYSGAILVPSERSLFDFYEKMGYKTCSAIGEAELAAQEGNLRLEKLGKQEYIDNRRLLLPQNGVVQENENVDFLATYASFYKCDGFLLAAYEADGALFGVELLGSLEAVPQAVAVLGCKKGFFRIPPCEQPNAKIRPFAMYLAFDYSPAPDYFGLAFD